MNILFVTPAPPFPPSDGARLIVAHIGRELCKQHTLFLVSFSHPETDTRECARVFADARFVPPPRAPRWRKWAASFLDDMPLWARACASREMAATLRDMTARHSLDVVHLDTGLMAQYIDAVSPLPTVAAPHDALSFQLQQRTAHAPDTRERLVARFQLPKMRRYETTYYARAARVGVVTEREKDFLHALAPSLQISVIPNGVDADYFAPLPVSITPHSIGFLGVMEYVPNQAAALYFAREGMPRVWREIPDARFMVIGRNPPPVIRALARDARVVVTGTVEDVRPQIAAQAVMVSPMLAAGGIKNKMLETMAMGRAVVATPQAAEGLDARADIEFLAARDANELANACVRLLRDNALRQRIGGAARAWALQHPWRVTADAYLDLYRAAAKN